MLLIKVPPVATLYQFKVPADGEALNATTPSPQREPLLTLTTFGMVKILASTDVRDALEQP